MVLLVAWTESAPVRLAEYLGYSASDVPSAAAFLEWFEARLHPDDRKDAARVCYQYLTGCTSRYFIDVKLKNKEGRWRYVRSMLSAVARDSTGVATRLVATLVDLSGQKVVAPELECVAPEDVAKPGGRLSESGSEYRMLCRRADLSEVRVQVIREAAWSGAPAFELNGGDGEEMLW